MTDINESLNVSLQALRTYHQFIKDASSQHVAPSEKENQELLNYLVDALDDTKSGLTEELTKDRVVRVDPRTVTAVNNAIETFLQSETTEDKVNAVHFAIYGSFWNVLREVQNLLHTITGLKRGKRVADIEEMDKEKEK